MRVVRIASLLLVGLSLALPSEAQSLGNVAKKERERRDKNKKEGVASREFSEEEVFGEKEEEKSSEDETGEEGESSEAPSAEATDAPIPGVGPTRDDGQEKFEKESRERKRSEAEWRSRAADARARIAAARERVKYFEELYLGPNEYYVDANGNTVVESAEQLQRMTREAKADLAAAEHNWKKIQEDARKSGIPPGWLR